MGYVKTVVMLTASIGLFAVGVTLVTLGGLLRLQSGLLSDNVVLLLNSISYNNIYIGINLLAMSYGSLIIGGLLMISSIAGCSGGYKRVKWILIIVVIINVFLMLAQFCLLGITVSLYGKMNEWFKGQLITVFKTYDGPFSSNVISLGFNYMFMEGRCCGINPQYSNGGTNNDFSTFSTTWLSSASDYVPASCCQGATASNLGSYVSSSQCGAVNPPINFYTAGCFNYIKETVSYNTYVIGAMTGLMLIFMVLLLISVCGLWNDQKNQVEAITISTPPLSQRTGATRRRL